MSIRLFTKTQLHKITFNVKAYKNNMREIKHQKMSYFEYASISQYNMVQTAALHADKNKVHRNIMGVFFSPVRVTERMM